MMSNTALSPCSDAAQDDDADELQGALAELRPVLYRRALFLTQQRAAADDLVQATIERALSRRATYRGGTNLRAWLGLIMRNLFVDEHRRKIVNVPLHDPPANDGASDGDSDGDGDEDRRPGRLDLLSLDDVKDAALALSSPRREVFTLAYFENLSYREIGERLGISPTTAGTRLFRARNAVRVRLERLYQQRLTHATSPAR